MPQTMSMQQLPASLISRVIVSSTLTLTTDCQNRHEWEAEEYSRQRRFSNSRRILTSSCQRQRPWRKP